MKIIYHYHPRNGDSELEILDDKGKQIEIFYSFSYGDDSAEAIKRFIEILREQNIIDLKVEEKKPKHKKVKKRK